MTETNDKSRPQRRWLRFSLRTVLIVLTAFCVWLGWFLFQVEQQRDAVKWILDYGGTVSYDFETDDVGKAEGAQPSAPQWLIDRLGVDFFSSVTHVSDVHHLQISDITPLAALKNLKVVDLSGTQVSDVTPLLDQTNLDWLNLSDTLLNEVTPLVGLTNLKVLILSGTPVSDVTKLSGQTNLEHLILRRTQVSDEQIKKLKQALPNCIIDH